MVGRILDTNSREKTYFRRTPRLENVDASKQNEEEIKQTDEPEFNLIQEFSLLLCQKSKVKKHLM
jgi:hypothetical protein